MDLAKIRYILIDIEGTTTSISFVKDILFPFVKENVKMYIQEHWDEHATKLDVDALQKQSEDDISNGVAGTVYIPKLSAHPTAEEVSTVQQAVSQNILWQMSLDRKTTALKQLQGHMWATAYETKSIYGHVYDDVPIGLELWHQKGINIYVYSSGSVEAQKLLFKNSIYGNLLNFIDGHFDTNIGSKTCTSSYVNILKELNVHANVVLFLTDVPKEAYAASDAGLNVVLVVRDGNAPLTEEDTKAFPCISSFLELSQW